MDLDSCLCVFLCIVIVVIETTTQESETETPLRDTIQYSTAAAAVFFLLVYLLF
jgi:hypothetical protein